MRHPSALPEPLAAVADYLAEDKREFVPTSELCEALDADPNVFAKDMRALNCRPTRQYVPTEDGGARRVRGYMIADIRTAIDRVTDEISGQLATKNDTS